MRVLVCGDRKWHDKWYLDAVLNSIHADTPITLIIEGEARGADTMSRLWAVENHVAVLPFPADWGRHGKAAGPIRNRRQLAEGKPELVVAFHENIRKSVGTRDMIRVAQQAGVPVRLFPPQEESETIAPQLRLF